MKSIVEYINGPVNESLDSVTLALLIYAAAQSISTLIYAIGLHNASKDDEEIVLTATEKLLKDRKAKKILKKVAQDKRTKEYFALSPKEQEGKLKKLLKEILSEEEYEQVHSVAKWAIQDLMKNNK